MLQRCEQERAKPPTFGAQAFEIIFFEKAREKGLRQILGVFLRVAAAADIGVEREPVGAAQFLQRAVGLRRGAFARLEHDRPVRRGEDIARRGRCRSGVLQGQMAVVTTASFFACLGQIRQF